MAADGTGVLEVAGLRKRFGGLTAVDNVSFKVAGGKLTCLVGPNGAGKTTIFNLITGAIRPDAGKVIYSGADVTDLSPVGTARAGISRTFQDMRLFDRMTVLENVMVAFGNQIGEHPVSVFVRPRRMRTQSDQLMIRARDIVERVGLARQSDVLTGALSYAEQKLVVIARSLAMGSALWLLDEPSSGLDSEAIASFLGLLRALVSEDRTILMVEHNLRVVEQVSDRVLFLDHGQLLAEGPPDEIFKRRELRELYMAGGAGS